MRRTVRWHHHYIDNLVYGVLHSIIMCYIQDEVYVNLSVFDNNQSQQRCQGEGATVKVVYTTVEFNAKRRSNMWDILSIPIHYFFLNIYVHGFKGTFLYGLHLQEGADRLPPWWGKCNLQDNVQVKLNKNLHIPSVVVGLWGSSVWFIFLFSGTDCWTILLWPRWCLDVLMCQEKEETGLPTTDSYK